MNKKNLKTRGPHGPVSLTGTPEPKPYKKRHFDLSAAILDDIMTQLWQQSYQSNRLIAIFDLIYDMTIFGQKLNLTPRTTPIFDPGSWFQQSWKPFRHRSSCQVSSKSAIRFSRRHCLKNLTYFFHGGHLGFWCNFRKASPRDRACKVWIPLAKWFVRRRLKCLTKWRPFDLSAAMSNFDKNDASDRLVDTFDLVWHDQVQQNLTPIWPPGHAHFWSRGHDFRNYERASVVDHSYQVSSNPPCGSWEDFLRICTIFRR